MHPTTTVWEGREYSSPRHHELSLMCDDLEATRAELEAKGATFAAPIADEGFGLTTFVERARRRPDHALPAEAPDRLRPLIAGRPFHRAFAAVIRTRAARVCRSTP